MIVEKACWERGCACYDHRVDEGVKVTLVQQENQRARDALPLMVEAFEKLEKRQKALAQPEQELEGINEVILNSIRDSSEVVAPPQREAILHTVHCECGAVYKVDEQPYRQTKPPKKKEWVGLTPEDKRVAGIPLHTNQISISDAFDVIEKILKEKNT